MRARFVDPSCCPPSPTRSVAVASAPSPTSASTGGREPPPPASDVVDGQGHGGQPGLCASHAASAGLKAVDAVAKPLAGRAVSTVIDTPGKSLNLVAK